MTTKYNSYKKEIRNRGISILMLSPLKAIHSHASVPLRNLFQNIPSPTTLTDNKIHTLLIALYKM